MDPIIGGALVSGLFGAGSSLLGGAIGSQGASAQNQMQMQLQRENNALQVAEAQKNRDYQTDMSNTAYQRSMADMRAAGLNPILAYKQGSASTPGGSMPSTGVANITNEKEAIGRGVGQMSASAREAASTVTAIDLAREQSKNQETQQQLNKANEHLSNASAVRTNQETATSAAQQKKTEAETALTIEQMSNPKALRELWGAQGHSAYQAGEIHRREAEDMHKYGSGRIGREILSPLDHVYNRAREIYKSAKPAAPVGGRGPDNSFPNLWNRFFK